MLQSNAVKTVLIKASRSHEDHSFRPVTVKSVTQMLDAILTSIIVRSLRRAMEFTEFTVGEWRSRTLHDDGTSTAKVKIHKTMAFGSAELILNNTEESALKAYMLCGRPLVTDCTLDTCPVFTSTYASAVRAECCTKLHQSNISAILT